MPVGSLDVNAIASTVTLFPEANNASTLATPDTPGQGVFISPSTSVAGRPADITGYFVVAATEEGKLEYNSGDGLLTLNELSDVTITNPIKGQYLGYNGSIWVNEFIDSTNPWKAPVRVATTANIALTGLQTIDTVALAAGDRVLVKDQADPVQNGIYSVVDGAAWVRTEDFLAGSSASCDAVCVQEGATNGGFLFKCINVPPNDVVNIDGLTFVTFGSGDVVGPASSTDNSIARWDTTTGKLLQDSVVSLSDLGAITGAVSIVTTTGISSLGAGAGGSVNLGGSGSSIANVAPSAGDKAGFFGVTAVSQQTAAGASGYASVGGSAVSSDDTFTGGVGAGAYTIGDIVAALKNLGLIAQ